MKRQLLQDNADPATMRREVSDTYAALRENRISSVEADKKLNRLQKQWEDYVQMMENEEKRKAKKNRPPFASRLLSFISSIVEIVAAVFAFFFTSPLNIKDSKKASPDIELPISDQSKEAQITETQKLTGKYGKAVNRGAIKLTVGKSISAEKTAKTSPIRYQKRLADFIFESITERLFTKDFLFIIGYFLLPAFASSLEEHSQEPVEWAIIAVLTMGLIYAIWAGVKSWWWYMRFMSLNEDQRRIILGDYFKEAEWNSERRMEIIDALNKRRD